MARSMNTRKLRDEIASVVIVTARYCCYLDQRNRFMTDPVAPFVTRLTHPDWSVREAACKELGGLGSQARAAVPAHVQILKDDSLMVRCAAAKALGATGPAAKDAVPALAEALRDKEWYFRAEVATALGRFGREGQGAVPALHAAMATETNRSARGLMARALKAILRSI